MKQHGWSGRISFGGQSVVGVSASLGEGEGGAVDQDLGTLEFRMKVADSTGVRKGAETEFSMRATPQEARTWTAMSTEGIPSGDIVHSHAVYWNSKKERVLDSRIGSQDWQNPIDPNRDEKIHPRCSYLTIADGIGGAGTGTNLTSFFEAGCHRGGSKASAFAV